MLVLSRKVGETIWIGDDVELVVTEVKGEYVKIGVRAPRTIDIIRGELRNDVRDANKEAVVKTIDLLKDK
ncbi:MAG: carbon storage regulator CsrA [Solibacillus sp.]